LGTLPAVGAGAKAKGTTSENSALRVIAGEGRAKEKAKQPLQALYEPRGSRKGRANHPVAEKKGAPPATPKEEEKSKERNNETQVDDSSEIKIQESSRGGEKERHLLAHRTSEESKER